MPPTAKHDRDHHSLEGLIVDALLNVVAVVLMVGFVIAAAVLSKRGQC